METWEDFVSSTDLDLSDFNLREDAVVKRVGSQWCVFSKKGKRLGCYSSRKQAVKRLQQIEYHKNKGSEREEARQLCYCKSCGLEFYSDKPCYQSVCPECGEQDSLIELTGIY